MNSQGDLDTQSVDPKNKHVKRPERTYHERDDFWASQDIVLKPKADVVLTSTQVEEKWLPLIDLCNHLGKFSVQEFRVRYGL